MIQPLRLFLATGIALLSTSLCVADETFPVVHNEPITVRIVGGINGQPLCNLHLVLIGGYDQSDLHQQLYREDALTDNFGKVRLSNQLTNLPWLQVWVGSMPLCQSKPRKASFSVELIRRDGLSAPNLCGPVSAQDSPGVFTVFVKNRAKKLKKGVAISLELPRTPLPAASQAPAQAAKTSVTPVATESSLTVPVLAVVTTTALPATPAEAPAETAPKTAVLAPAAVPAPILPQASAPAIVPAKAVVHLQTRRVAAKAAVHRVKPGPPACSTQSPATKATTTSRSQEESGKVQPRRTPVRAARHSKPLAGVRLIAEKPAPSSEPPKKD